MLTRRAFTSLVSAGLAAAPQGGIAATPTASSRRQEAESLVRFAETTHPDGLAARNDPKWRAQARDLIAKADALDEARYPVAALGLLSWFRDGHTGVNGPALHEGVWGFRFPLGVTLFSDGLYVTAAKDEAMPLLGARVTHVAGAPVESVIRRFAAIWPAVSVAGPHRWSILLLRSAGFLNGLGFANGAAGTPVAIEGVLPDGALTRASIRPRPDGAQNLTALAHPQSDLERYTATQNYGPQPDLTEDGRNFVWLRDGGKILFVSLDRMSDDDFGKPFAVFRQEFLAALEAPGAERLIIDLRRNGGGDNMLCEGLRKHIQRSRFNRPGGLIVLISPHTFSAAQNLANRLERECFAFFVGEPTGSSPNHCGDAKIFDAAATKIPAQVSTLRWQDSNPRDTRTAIMPDLMVPSRFSDYAAGRDVALEAALQVVDSREPDDEILTAPWKRQSQQQVWRPFWM